MRYLNDPTDPHDLDLTLEVALDVVGDGRVRTVDYVAALRARGFVPHEETWLIDTGITLGLVYDPADNTLRAEGTP